MITELGFLSPEIEKSEKKIIKKYYDLFQLSERMSKIFIGLLKQSKIDRKSIKNLAMNALAAKSLELYQSSIILLRKGCIPATKAICRALIETVYKLCAIQLKKEGINLYIHQEKCTRLQKLRRLREYKQRYPNSPTPPDIELVFNKLKNEKPKKTDPHVWASLAEMEDFHDIYYQVMSDDTHANIESLNHYFDEKSAHILSFGPSDKWLAPVAIACHRALINAMQKFALFQGTNITTELSQFNNEINLIEKKYNSV
jgi:hypothetical protein